MARRRFFVPEVRRGVAELTGPDAEHLVRVLRAEAGQIYEISDNQRIYLAEIESARKSLVSFKILEELTPRDSSFQVTLLPALFKFDRFEWMIEKATELGVAEIQPVEATRTEHGLAQAALKRRARWERIALESSQQSRRIHLPVVHSPIRFPNALAIEAKARLFLDEHPDAPPLRSVLPESHTASDPIALLLGPEGGWTDQERAQAQEAGWQSCSLGANILRAETAAIAALAIVTALW